MKALIAIGLTIATTASITAAFAGQGAGRMLYTVPNNTFIESPTGDTIVTVSDTSGSVTTLQTLISNARGANPNAIVIIHLLNGATYTVKDAGLVLSSGECLVGTGATIVAANSSVTNTLVTIASGATNVSISGGTYNGNGAPVYAIYGGGNNRVNIDQVTALNCGQDCIQLNGNGAATFDNELTVTRSDASGSPSHSGISIWNATQTVCVDNNCHNNSVGIWMGNNGYCTIANNTCESNVTGIDFSSGNDNYIANNTCNNNATGILLNGSSTMVVSDSLASNTAAGINSAGSGNIFCDNLFSVGNAATFLNNGSGDNVVAYKGALSAAGQNYFYPPLVDNQHTTVIVNGMGRHDLYDSSTGPIDNVQSEYDSALGSYPNTVIVLHLNGSYTVGANPLTLSSYTSVLLGGTIQINASTSASCAVTANSGASYISISGGTIDGGTTSAPSNGRDAIYFSGVGMFQIDGMTLQNFGNNSQRVGGSDVVRIDHGSTPRIVTRNTVNGGSARGIWVATSGVRDIVSDNTVTDVQMDGVDCDESTFASLIKFNYLSNNSRYGVFLEQSASDNCVLGNICNYNSSFDIGCYNNSSTPRGATAYNSIICNSLLGDNGLRNGSTGDGSSVTSSDNFFFNNTVMNANVQSQNYGSQNYYSQNYMGNSSLSTSGTEVFFNSPDVSGNQLLKDSHSGLAVLVTNAATSNGASVITGIAAALGNYEWQLIPTDSGFYRLMNENSDLAMVVLGASTSPGADIIQWTYNASGNDEWMPLHAPNGLYSFVNRLSGLDLDVTGAGIAQGTQLDQQPSSGAANQQFGLADGPTAVAAAGTNAAAWTGGGAPDGNWQTAVNWGGVGVSAGDWLSFGSGAEVLTTNNFPAGTIFDNIAFVSAAPSFILAGNGMVLANILESTNGIFSGGSITNYSINVQSINLPVTLASGTHTIAGAAGAGQLNFGGALGRAPGALAQFNNGGVIDVTGSGLANNTAGIVGGWALVSTAAGLVNNSGGAGTVNWAAINSGNIAAYSSYTAITGSGATIPNSPGANVQITGNGSADDKVAGTTTTVNTIYWTAANSGNGYIDIPAGSTLQLGAQGAIMANTPKYFRVGNGTSTGALTAGGASSAPGELSLYNLSYYAGGAFEVWCYITDNGSGAYPVMLNVFGSVNIDFPNTYSGGTYIQRGDAYLNLAGATFGSGPIYVFPGGRADYGGQNGVTVVNNFFLEGPGFLANSQPGAIKGAYNGEFTGTFTLLGDTSIDPNAGSWPNTCTFAGDIGGTGSLTVGGPANVVAGTATLAGTSSYSGDLMIDASANVNSGSGVCIAAGRNNIITIGGNVDLIGGGSKPAAFDLNGTTQTINGLTSPSGTVATAIVTNSSAVPATLLISNQSAATFAGAIVEGNNGPIALAQIGPGTQTLTGLNTYRGNTTVSVGRLALSGLGSIANSPMIALANGAVLDASGRPDQTLTLASGQTLGGSGTVNFDLTTGSGSVVAPGSVSAIGHITVAGTASLEGSTVMKLAAGQQINDQINASTINYGGTLTVTNLFGTLAAGQSFQLFQADTYSGTFSTIHLPSLGAGLTWSNNLAGAGQLSVVNSTLPLSSLAITSVQVAGADLVLSGSNIGAGIFYLVTTTNPALPLNLWQSIATNSVATSGNFSLTATNAFAPETFQRFFSLKAIQQ